MTGTFLLARSKSAKLTVHSLPARRDIAIKCMMAFVLQPIAIAVAIAFKKLVLLKMRLGVRSSHTISTILLPQAAAIRG